MSLGLSRCGVLRNPEVANIKEHFVATGAVLDHTEVVVDDAGHVPHLEVSRHPLSTTMKVKDGFSTDSEVELLLGLGITDTEVKVLIWRGGILQRIEVR